MPKFTVKAALFVMALAALYLTVARIWLREENSSAIVPVVLVTLLLLWWKKSNEQEKL